MRAVVSAGVGAGAAGALLLLDAVLLEGVLCAGVEVTALDAEEEEFDEEFKDEEDEELDEEPDAEDPDEEDVPVLRVTVWLTVCTAPGAALPGEVMAHLKLTTQLLPLGAVALVAKVTSMVPLAPVVFSAYRKI